MTPLYDVMSAQPSLDARQIERKQMKLAMSAGTSRHYRIDEIRGRHFIQTAEAAGLPAFIAMDALKEVARAAPAALSEIEKALPSGFPKKIHSSITSGFLRRLEGIED